MRVLLHYNDKESKMYIPNEIFDDISLIEGKGSGHIAFTYSYYYLVNWMYRYAKYGQSPIDVKMIKQALGYSETNKTMDYIIKKGGVLDSINYTSTTSDYPVIWEFNKNSLKITTLNGLDSYSKEKLKERHTNRFNIKYPIKSFYRTIESESDQYEDGTYFDISNTHEIPFEVFLFCMSNKELGCAAFYLWSYLKMMNQMFKRGYDVGLERLSKEVYIPRKTLSRYLDVLKMHNMIHTIINQDYFSSGVKQENRKSNTYITQSIDQFSVEGVNYKKIPYSKQVDTSSKVDELFV